MFKSFVVATSLFASAVLLSGCEREADVASRNVSVAADSFEVSRRIVFYNGINGDYILTIEGFCSLGNTDSNKQLSVTCKTGLSQYKKHFLGLSDNVTYFAEQTTSTSASGYHYRVVFKPSLIIPDVNVQ